jgi:lipopolysaccharide transport system permease protein
VTRPFRQQVELVLSLAKRDLKARYKDSVFGFFWSLFRPAFLTLIIWLVFGKLLKMKFPHDVLPYWSHVLVSILAWNYFIGSLFDASGSVIANASLLKKVKLDAEVFPIASILANAVHFGLALVVVFVLLGVTGVGVSGLVVFLPAIIVLETLLILGCALYLSAFNVFYRDVGSALEVLSMAWFYVTPIIYPAQVAWDEIMRSCGPVAGRFWFSVYMLNPVAPVVVAIRKVVLFGRGHGEIYRNELYLYLAVSVAVAAVLSLSGWFVFRRLSRRFVDEL